VSVVVATHNRAGNLERMLAGLAAQERPADEVIVVDDGSTDDTQVVLERHRGRGTLPLRVIRRPAAAGPATAREEGWHAASGELVAFTDDDCVPLPGWLAAGERAWARDSDSFVQGRT
jgi:glycosyltransferase involved in cell wall biosynthesis